MFFRPIFYSWRSWRYSFWF